MSGTFFSTDFPFVSIVAHKIGRAAFFDPLISTSPFSGFPPSIINFGICVFTCRHYNDITFPSKTTFMKKLSSAKLFDQFAYALLFFLPLIFLTFLNNSFELPKMMFFELGVLGMLFFYVINLAYMKRPELKIYSVFRKRSVKIAMLVFIVMIFLSTAFSIAPELSFWGSYYRLQGAHSFAYYFLFFLLLVMNFHSKEQWDRAFRSIFVGFFFVLLFAVLQKLGLDFTGFDLEEVSLGRVFSSFGQTNYLAAYILLISFPLLSYVFLNKKKWPLIALLILGFIVLSFTGSRAAMLGLFVGIVFYLILGSVFLWGKKWLLLAAAVFLLPLMSVFYANYFHLENDSLMGRLVVNEYNMRSIDSRLLVWKSSLEMIKDLGFTGNGLETFSLALGPYMSPSVFEFERLNTLPDRAHNSFLQLFSDFGIVGPVFYLFVFIYIFGLGISRLRKLNKRKKILVIGILSTFLSLFVNNLFSFSVTVHFAFSAFLLAFLLFLLSEKTVKKSIVMNKVIVLVISFFVFFSAILQNVFPLVADSYARSGDLQTATLLHPKQNYYGYALSSVYLKLGEFESALYELDRVGAFVSEQDVYYYFLKGKIYHEQCVADGVYCDEAEDSYMRAFQLSPNYPPVLLNWGIFHIETDDCELGLSKLNQYLDIVPDSYKSPGTEKHRLFYKHNPYFDTVFDYTDKCSP